MIPSSSALVSLKPARQAALQAIMTKGQIQNEKIKINILKDGTLDIGNSFWAAADQIKFKGSEQYLLLPENENDLKIIDIMSDMTDSFESSGYHFKTGPVVEFRNLEHIHAQTHI